MSSEVPIWPHEKVHTGEAAVAPRSAKRASEIACSHRLPRPPTSYKDKITFTECILQARNMRDARAGDFIHAGDKSIQRDHSFPELPLFLYGLSGTQAMNSVIGTNPPAIACAGR